MSGSRHNETPELASRRPRTRVLEFREAAERELRDLCLTGERHQDRRLSKQHRSDVAATECIHILTTYRIRHMNRFASLFEGRLRRRSRWRSEVPLARHVQECS